ncbi:MAG: hypothetical protein JJD96_07255 [Thermoleophilia bacterium]|nr:hypothetical protein [Thermoleophilia bacterium]
MKRATYITAFLIIVAILSGCGETRHGDEPREDGLQLEAGADIATTEQGTATTAADLYTAADLPIDTNLQLEFETNRPGTTTPVSFNLEGPWKFTNGPREATLTLAMSEKAMAPESKQFPEASVVAASSWDRGASGDEYIFQSKDDSTLYSYGRSFPDGRVTVYSAPSRALIFPIAPGDSWVDSYTEEGSGKPVEITAENTLLAKNRLTLPAGTFNAWLLQTRVTAKTGGTTTTTTLDYTWFVPGIGRAAEIISMPNEHREVFSTARAFYRLKSYR